MGARRKQVLLLMVVLALGTAVGDARGQCAMCSANAQAAGDPEEVSRTLAAAIGVLFLPTLGLLGGAGLLLWKYRDADGRGVGAGRSSGRERPRDG